MSPDRHPGPLLIVEDREDVRTGLRRYFSLFFKTILLAAIPTEAQRHLEESEPSLLLCDYWLGNQFPPSTELIAVWRTRFPFIRGVALMTGTKASALEGSEGVDVVFQKPLELDAVSEWLLQAAGNR